MRNGCGESCKAPGNNFSQLFSTFLHFVLAGGFGVVAGYPGNEIFRPFLEFSGVRNGCGKSCKAPGNHFSPLFFTFLHFVLAGGFGVVARYLGKQISQPFLQLPGLQNASGKVSEKTRRGVETSFLLFSNFFSTFVMPVGQAPNTWHANLQGL